MKAINITTARQNLYQIVNETNKSHIPIEIIGKNGNAVLLSSDDWSAIQETLFLNAIPGVADSIIDGMSTPIENCIAEKEVEW